MSNAEQVHITADGKLEIDLPRAFKVRLLSNDYRISALTSEIVWAHSYSPVEGALVFVLLKAKDVKLQDETGAITTRPMALQTYCRTIAPGVWYDVTEEVIPEINSKNVN